MYYKKASLHEIPYAHALLVNCGIFMFESLNLDHWYPFMSLAVFAEQLHEKDLYLVFAEGELVATFNLSLKPRDYYSNITWRKSFEPALYLGHLGVNLTKQGQGIGKLCMQYIEDIAKAMPVDAIRFDALDKHPWLKKFYFHQGYNACGTVKPNKWDLICLEKNINTSPK